MLFHKANPVDSFENLRARIDRLFKTTVSRSNQAGQLSLDLSSNTISTSSISYPTQNISEFLDFFSDFLPEGDMYLFGGVLRDIALLGRRGFNSDIDVVVEGCWENCVPYLESLGARKNKFGGFRLEVAGWPIDIWNARETWAIKQGFVSYEGISSLTETTVMNWDAILMNWRKRNFICHERYLDSINKGVLDLVLEQNPNPLGMAVRVFRHLCIKDAKKITPRAANYLASCTSTYSFEEIRKSEFRSYGNSVVELPVYAFFETLKRHENFDMHERFDLAGDYLRRQGVTLSHYQVGWNFENLIYPNYV